MYRWDWQGLTMKLVSRTAAVGGQHWDSARVSLRNFASMFCLFREGKIRVP